MSVSFPKPLTEKEEIYYIERYEKGDPHARQILIERNLRLVAHVQKNMQPSPRLWRNTSPSAPSGSSSAVNTYRSSRRVRLSTYAALLH